MPKPQSDRYIRFYGPILDALRALGGSATPKEVKTWILERVQLSEVDRNRTLKSGDNAVENEIAWARDFLKRFGLLDPSVRGVWSLTAEGEKSHLDLQASRKLREVYAFPGSPSVPSAPDEEEEQTHEEPTLLETILALAPKGFEKLCQRLLREAGFSEVHVTGQSGDGGIDGHGILQVNELVSFRVLF